MSLVRGLADVARDRLRLDGEALDEGDTRLSTPLSEIGVHATRRLGLVLVGPCAFARRVAVGGVAAQ